MRERYCRLKEVFNRHASTISNIEERKDYLFGNSQRDQLKKGVILGCKNIIQQAEKYEIPEYLLMQVPYPELWPEVQLQCNSDSCSTASIRTAILIKNGKKIAEPQLWRMNDLRYKENEDTKKLIENGLGPKEIAHILRFMEKKYFGRKVKVYMTLHGDLNQLSDNISRQEYPIINRPWGYAPWETGKLDNHYELVWGLDKNKIYLYNPENKEPKINNDVGLYSFTHKDFMKWWAWGHDCKARKENSKEERWYIVAIPAQVELSKIFPKGKYM